MEVVTLNIEKILLLIHLIGVFVGFGGAVISDALFFKFFTNRYISKSEKHILQFISKIIWTGFLIFTVSGAVLFNLNSERLMLSESFLPKLIIVTIILLNGLLLNLKISPNITKLTLEQGLTRKYRYLRILALTCGFISAFSWFSAFAVAVTKGLGFPWDVILKTYFVILFLGILLLNLVEDIYNSMGTKKTTN